MLNCQALLNIWKQRWLSLAGKIQIFKSLIASKPVYVSTMTTVSDNFCQTLQSLQKEFIWRGRKAKIKHSTLTGDYHLGGLQNVDIPSKIFSLKFMCIKALKDRENFHSWKLVTSHLLSPVPGEVLPNKEVGGSLDLISSLKGKFEARSGKIHQIREKFGKFCHHKTQKLGKSPNLEVISEIQRAKFGVFLEAKSGAPTRMSEASFGAKQPPTSKSGSTPPGHQWQGNLSFMQILNYYNSIKVKLNSLAPFTEN